jgi:hypothetical protein
MKKYFIKDGFNEKGPFTIDDLKKLKIKKTTFIREEFKTHWFLADSLDELSKTSILNFKFLKITLLIILTFVIIIFIFLGVSKSNTSSIESLIEVEDPIPVPPTIEFKVTNHEKRLFNELFKDCNGYKQELIETCNYTNSLVRNTAVSIAGQNDGLYNIGQICDIFDYCYNNWKYVNDPNNNEIIEFASNTLLNGLNGDCDDFAVLICSMILSIGGEARINFAYDQDGGHAFTEVNIGKTKIEDYIFKRYKKIYDNSGIWTRLDNDGNNWLNLDWFANYPGGQYFDYTHGTSYYIITKYCNDFTN